MRMRQGTLKTHILSILFLLGTGIGSAFAMGNYPPPPPPTGFIVNLNASSIVAQWNPNPNVVQLSMDGTEISYANGSAGSISVNKLVDLTKSHQFTLTALNVGGQSAPATYTYTPALPPPPPNSGTVFYQFENLSSTSPVIGNVAITIGSANIVDTQLVNAGQTLQGQNQAPAGYYQVWSTGTSPLLNETVTCSGSIASGSNITGYTILVIFHNAENPNLFSCNMSLKY
jgi:hypothetical protein